MLSCSRAVIAIPVIDLAPTRGQTHRLQVARQIDEACCEIGFFTITGHGVPDQTSSDLRAAAHAFFELSLAEKLKSSHPVKGTNRGYHPGPGRRNAAARFDREGPTGDGIRGASMTKVFGAPIEIGGGRGAICDSGWVTRGGTPTVVWGPGDMYWAPRVDLLLGKVARARGPRRRSRLRAKVLAPFLLRWCEGGPNR